MCRRLGLYELRLKLLQGRGARSLPHSAMQAKDAAGMVKQESVWHRDDFVLP